MKFLIATLVGLAVLAASNTAEAFGGRRNRQVNVVKVVAVHAQPVIVAQAVVAQPVILHQKVQAVQAVQVVAQHNCGVLAFSQPVAVVQQVNHRVNVQAVVVGHSCGVLY